MGKHDREETPRGRPLSAPDPAADPEQYKTTTISLTGRQKQQLADIARLQGRGATISSVFRQMLESLADEALRSGGVVSRPVRGLVLTPGLRDALKRTAEGLGMTADALAEQILADGLGAWADKARRRRAMLDRAAARGGDEA